MAKLARYLALTLALALVGARASAQQKTALTASSTACATANSCLAYGVDSNSGAVTFTISSTSSGSWTAQFEATGDGGTTWVAFSVTPSNSATAVTSATGSGTWQANVSGYTSVRVRLSTYSSGSAIVSIIPSTASARANSGSGGGGGVSAVTGTAPIASSGGTSPAISCATCATGASSLTVNQPIVGGGSEAIAALATAFTTQTDGATVTWAIGSAWVANATLTFTVHSGSRTLNITGPLAGGNYVLKLVQDATGGEGLTLGTGCTWKVSGGGAGAITPSTGAGAVDVLAFTYDGSACLANFNKNFN